MYETMPTEGQRTLARFTVDSGADLVLGAHPHVIQGIEVYNGRFIVYSLADFSYAGHSSPDDLDSFVFQQTFTFIDGELQPDRDAAVIPLMQSSRRPIQNFQPTPAEGEDAERIRQRMRLYSSWLNDAEGMRTVEGILSE
jgi:poly-gamma-glutamate synthesis protein (capsule biosynthesis protein)